MSQVEHRNAIVLAVQASLWNETPIIRIVWQCVSTCYSSTVGPQLSESPLSEPSVIRTLFLILKYQKTIRFSAKASNKWNACVIFRLVRLIVS